MSAMGTRSYDELNILHRATDWNPDRQSVIFPTLKNGINKIKYWHRISLNLDVKTLKEKLILQEKKIKTKQRCKTNQLKYKEIHF